MASSIVVQVSGGFDSAAVLCLCLMTYHADVIIPHFIDYEQAYASHEVLAAAYVVSELQKQATRILPLEISKVSTPLSSTKPDYFPIRNLLLLSLSASLAISKGASKIAIGSKTTLPRPNDPWCFRDCTTAFFEAAQKTLFECTEPTDTIPEIIRPLVIDATTSLDKVAVLRILKQFNLNLKNLWSCYSNLEQECHTCYHCKELAKAKSAYEEIYGIYP